MKIPRSLMINGRRWRVRLADLERRGMLGACSYRTREILIDRGIPVSERGEVFLHEVLHACLTEHWNADREEQMVSRLAPRLLATLQGLGWVK